MKQIIYILLTILIICTLFSCTTTTATNGILNEHASLEREYLEYDCKEILDDYSFSIDYTQGFLAVIIENKTDKVIQFDQNQSVYVCDGLSYRVVEGNTRVIDSAKVQPIISIGPHSAISIHLYNSENKLLPCSDGATLYSAVIKNGETEIIPLKLSERKITVDGPVREVIGKVSVEFSDWHWLFLGDSEAKILEALTEKANMSYSEGSYTLENVVYKKDWSPMSLLMYFNLLGYVDTITATAEVVIYKP